MRFVKCLQPIDQKAPATLSVSLTRNFRLLRWTAPFAVILLLGGLARTETQAPTARSILERAARLQGGGALAEKGAIKDFYVHLIVPKYEPGDGLLASGQAKHWYMPPTESRKWPLMKKWWKSNAETISGLTFKSTRRREFERAWSKQGKRVTWLSPSNEKDLKSIGKLRREAKDMDLLLRTFMLKNLMGKDVSLTLLPPGVEKDHKILRVRRTAKGERDYVIWISAESFDVSETTWHVEKYDLVGVRLPAARKGQVEQTFAFAKHKLIKGIRVPKRIEIFERTFEEAVAEKAPRSTTVAFVQDLVLNQGLTQKDFAPPE
jgi:hypothetical protein